MNHFWKILPNKHILLMHDVIIKCEIHIFWKQFKFQIIWLYQIVMLNYETKCWGLKILPLLDKSAFFQSFANCNQSMWSGAERSGASERSEVISRSVSKPISVIAAHRSAPLRSTHPTFYPTPFQFRSTDARAVATGGISGYIPPKISLP